MADTILALDLGLRVGCAFGTIGDKPSAIAVTLRPRGCSRGTAFYNFLAWFGEKVREVRPTLIVKEALLPVGALANKREKAISSQASVEITYFLHGAAEAIAAAHVTRIESGHVATVRKAFIGKGRVGNRADMKVAVIARCHLLRWLPRDCDDHDKADALALWEWARGAFFSRASELYLYGEEARA